MIYALNDDKGTWYSRKVTQSLV